MRWIPLAWLALPLELMHVVVAADPVAGHILHGLDHDDSYSSETSKVDATPSETLATGSGPAFASSCQAALWSWKKSSESFASQHQHPTTSTRPGSIYATYTYTDFTGGVKATSLTTLCDGYPRAIGSASYIDIETTTISYSPYGISTSAPAPFTTPMPCSISPSDCSELWKSFASSTSVSLVFENKSALEPPCQTDTGNTTIPFQTAACNYDTGYGPGVGVIGSEVRLLYWPVRTAESETDYFCSKYNPPSVTPSYLPGTRTGSGPNTFVTGDLTITSPTVALSFRGLHRLDGCGPTVDHTILTLPPSQLSSVRGARAAYGWYPFNLADLNWRCGPPNGTFTLQDTNQTTNGSECYQDVAAQAYWGAAPQVDYARGAGNTFYSDLTIVNNYRPYVIPDQKVGTEMLHSLWGSSATWWIDGSWDPPLALTEASAEALPTLPGGEGVPSVTTGGSGGEGGPTTPAMTAHSTPTEVVPTALSEVMPTASSEAGQTSQTLPTGKTPPNSAAGVTMPSESPASPSNGVPPTVGSEGGSMGGAGNTDQATDLSPTLVSDQIYWRSTTLIVGAAAQTMGDQVVSAADAGLVLEHESSTTTIPYATSSAIPGSGAGTPTSGAPSPHSSDGGEDAALSSDSPSNSNGGGQEPITSGFTSSTTGQQEGSSQSSASIKADSTGSASGRTTQSLLLIVSALALALCLIA